MSLTLKQLSTLGLSLSSLLSLIVSMCVCVLGNNEKQQQPKYRTEGQKDFYVCAIIINFCRLTFSRFRFVNEKSLCFSPFFSL